MDIVRRNWSWSLLGLKGLFGWCTTYQVNSTSRVTSQKTQQWSLALKQWHNKLSTKERHNSAYTVYWLGILSIIPLLQSTPDNSNLAQTRTKIDFPWISFIMYIYYNFTLSNSNHAFSLTKRDCSPKHLNYFNNHVFFVFTFLSVQFEYSVPHCVLIKFEVCMLLAFIPPSHFLISGYLLLTPDD